MMVKLPNRATANHFADAMRKALTPLAERISTGDGRISKADAKRALDEGGLVDIAREGLEAIANGGAMSVRAFVETQVERARQEAAGVTGTDAFVSRSDAEQLPRDLRLAFHLLRDGKIPDGPFAAGLGARVPESWRGALAGEPEAMKALANLDAFLVKERQSKTIYPPPDQVFEALEKTPMNKVKVVLIGQDPYHGPGEAHGLSFSVPDGVKIPPSLRNILKELEAESGQPAPTSGNLEKWAERGVLLLNAALTVEKDKPASHSKKGWETITNAVLRAIDAQDQSVVFLTLGKHAQKLAEFVDTAKHTVVKRSHPSPFSARRDFLGTAPFSEVNRALEASGRGTVDWSLS
jgi:uracil-DNA glycosylase